MSTCVDCRFWAIETISADGNKSLGACRGGPPCVVIKPNGNPITAWPLTKSTEWCGAFEPSQKASA